MRRKMTSTAAVLAMLAATIPALPASAASPIQATLVDALLVDNDGDGVADPGDTIRYTATIENTTPEDLVNVAFNAAVDVNMTLDPTSIRSTPVASHDAYVSLGNVGIAVGPADGLLGNDLDPDSTGPVLVSVVDSDSSSVNGGTVSIMPDGAFNYYPPVGFSGTDSFTYSVVDADGNLDSAQVSIAVSDVVWFIKSPPSFFSPSVGTYQYPFRSMVDFNNEMTGSGDVVFVYQGDNYTSGIVLSDQQVLLGQGVDLLAELSALGIVNPPFSLLTVSPAFPNPPLISTVSGNAITVAADNTVRGLDVRDTAGYAVAGTGVGNLTVDAVSIGGNGGALSLTGGNLAISLASLEAATTGLTPVQISSSTGSLDVVAVDGAISANASPAINIAGGSLNLGLTFEAVSSASSPTSGIILDGTTGRFAVTGDGTSTANGSGGVITAASGPGVLLTGVENVSLSGMDINTNLGDGVAGYDVDNLSIAYDRIFDNGDALGEAGISLGNTSLGQNGVTGSFNVGDSEILGNFDLGVDLANQSGALEITVHNTALSMNGGSAFAYEGTGASSLILANLTDNTAADNGSGVFVFDASDTATAAIIIDGTAATGNNDFGQITANDDAQVRFAITNNGTSVSPMAFDSFGITAKLLAGSTGAAVLQGVIESNYLTMGPTSSDGITLKANGSGSLIVDVVGNTVEHDGFFSGIYVTARDGSPSLDTSIIGNTVTMTGDSPDYGILVNGGVLPADAPNVCAAIGSSTVVADENTVTSASTGIRVRQRAVSTFVLPGFAGDGTDSAIVEAYLDGRNNAVAGSTTITTGFAGEADCDTPTVPSPPVVLAPPTGTTTAFAPDALQTVTVPHPAVAAAAVVALPVDQVSINVPVMNPGQTVVITFEATINSVAPIEVCTQGLLTADGQPDGLTDDPATAALDDPTCTAVPQADLSITKTDSVDPVEVGTDFAYTVTVSNAGPSTALNVVVTDTLPAGVVFVSSSGCAEDPTGVPTCSLGTIPAGASASYTINVSAPAIASTATNDGAVTSSTHDPDLANNATTESTTFFIPNLPPVADANGPYTVDEGATVLLDASGSSDPDLPEDSLTYTWDFDGDGVFGESGPGALFGDETGIAPTFDAGTIDGPASIPIVLRVTDQGGLSDNASAIVEVANVAPTVADLNSGSIEENDTFTLIGTISDPASADTFDVTIDWGDGTLTSVAYPAGSTSINETHLYLDDDADDSYDVHVTVTDDDGGAGQATTSVAVANVVPAIESVSILADEIDEADGVNLVVVFSDPGSIDVHTVSVDWMDGSAPQTITLPVGDRLAIVNHVYLDDDPTGTPVDDVTPAVEVLDDDGGSSGVFADASIRVNNVPPLLDNIVVSPFVLEGQIASVVANIVDPGVLDTFTVDIDWGDGTTSSTPYPAGSAAINETHIYVDDNPTDTASDIYPISISITDDDTGAATYLRQIEVRNVAPRIDDFLVTAGANENGTVTASGTIVDPGTGDTFVLTIDWDEGAPQLVNLPAGTTSFSVDHQYLDDDPTGTPTDVRTISVSLADDDLGVDAASASTTISNVAPALIAGSIGSPVAEGSQTTLSADISDPGTLDTFVVDIDWGDGTPLESFTFGPDNRAIGEPHIYADDGTYTVTATVTDDDTGVGTLVLDVVVENRPPQVTISSLTQTVQYSDYIAEVLITASDVAADPLTLATSLLPAGLLVVSDGCSANGFEQTCSWRIVGPVGVPEGTYPIAITVSDDDAGATVVDTEIVVQPEDASVRFDSANPDQVPAATDGGGSIAFSLKLQVEETEPDAAANAPAPGDIGTAEVSLMLVPVGPGLTVGPVACSTVVVIGSGYDSVLTVSCPIVDLAVNAYEVQATVSGGYYTGYAEDMLLVADPSLGFTTGGGWFYWPGTEDVANGYAGDKTNFGYTTKYDKNGELGGNLLVTRHLRGGGTYRLKSTSMGGLAIGTGPDWAIFTGQGTYTGPGGGSSARDFMVYVEDGGNPGAGSDRFWIVVFDGAGAALPAASMNYPATTNAQTLGGGNLTVPHVRGKN